ncbi:MAG: hypothetical protein A4E73_03482 [Syntrophaceae bacterium PtaU1.Bin231]|nr:MAG: hypothetical protein A4E73_03482 [Syntrophaceae bacterium PtaU1.Bin231]
MSNARITGARIARSGILLLAALSLILSCASPMRLTDNWKSSAHTGPAYSKIMVVAMTNRVDMQRYFENEFAGQLKSRGVEAAASHALIPDPDKGTREELIRLSRGMGIEAYLIIRVLGTGTEVQSYGASDRTSESMTYLPWFGPSPAMIKEREALTMESRLYDGKSLDLVWRSTATVVDPYGSPEQISGFAGLIVKTLGDHKLIPARWPGQ